MYWGVDYVGLRKFRICVRCGVRVRHDKSLVVMTGYLLYLEAEQHIQPARYLEELIAPPYPVQLGRSKFYESYGYKLPYQLWILHGRLTSLRGPLGCRNAEFISDIYCLRRYIRIAVIRINMKPVEDADDTDELHDIFKAQKPVDAEIGFIEPRVIKMLTPCKYPWAKFVRRSLRMYSVPDGDRLIEDEKYMTHQCAILACMPYSWFAKRDDCRKLSFQMQGETMSFRIGDRLWWPGYAMLENMSIHVPRGFIGVLRRPTLTIRFVEGSRSFVLMSENGTVSFTGSMSYYPGLMKALVQCVRDTVGGPDFARIMRQCRLYKSDAVWHEGV